MLFNVSIDVETFGSAVLFDAPIDVMKESGVRYDALSDVRTLGSRYTSMLPLVSGHLSWVTLSSPASGAFYKRHHGSFSR
jgi:hypothetical protein